MGMFAWLARWLSQPPRPIPRALWCSTIERYPFLRVLGEQEKARLKTLCEAFLASKEFSAAGGLVLTDAICVAIAAQGCLPILELGLAAYRDWVGIVVYPDEFIVTRSEMDDAGVVHEYADVLSGEAWAGGPLLISWHDAAMASADYNVVIHEFAHKLDMLNGEADGIPELPEGLSRQAWLQDFIPAYSDFCARVDGGETTRIDPYASEAPEEFFAVSSECFFGAPDILAAEYPALYRLLVRYYRQDPLARQQLASDQTSRTCSPGIRAGS